MEIESKKVSISSFIKSIPKKSPKPKQKSKLRAITKYPSELLKNKDKNKKDKTSSVSKIICKDYQFSLSHPIEIDKEFYSKLNGVVFPSQKRFPTHLKDTIKAYYDEIICNGKNDTTIPIKNKEKQFIDINETLYSYERDSLLSVHSIYWNSKRLNEIAERHLPIKIRKNKKANFAHIEALVTNISKEINIFTEIETWEMINGEKRILPNKTKTNIGDSYSQFSGLLKKEKFDQYARKPKILIEYVDEEQYIYNMLPPEDLAFIKRNESNFIYWNKDFSMGFRIIEDKYLIYLVTSIGQLNFFQWAISFKVLDYVEQNLEFIESKMEEYKKIPKPEGMKKRKSLIINKIEKKDFLFNQNENYKLSSLKQ